MTLTKKNQDNSLLPRLTPKCIKFMWVINYYPMCLNEMLGEEKRWLKRLDLGGLAEMVNGWTTLTPAGLDYLAKLPKPTAQEVLGGELKRDQLAQHLLEKEH